MKSKHIFSKVIGIGFPKTATTSLTSALEILGINTVHNNTLYKGKDPIEVMRKDLSEYTGFTDAPFHRIYKEVDEAFPKSKFILTVRDPEKWWSSWQRHHKAKEITLREDRSQRYSEKNKDKYVREYVKTNREKIDYFKNRYSDLLVIDITNDSYLWEKLCLFLEKDIPNIPFPHLNKKARLVKGNP